MLKNRKFAMSGNGLEAWSRSITHKGDRKSRVKPRTGRPGGRAARRPPTTKGIQLSDTIHLHDLTPAERLVEESAERGFIDEKELTAFADEHELPEDELAALRTALEERDVIVRAEAPTKAGSYTASSGGTLDPLQLFMDAAGRHSC